MDRRSLIGGNWKMHLDAESAAALASDVAAAAAGITGAVDLAVFPPHPYLQCVFKAAGGHLLVGGQDVSDQPEGAFTGQVSAAMLADCGCQLTLVGHSERRHGLGETGPVLAQKSRQALRCGLRVLLCVGETLEDREAGRARDVVLEQLRGGLEGVSTEAISRVDLAYEPVWAIGTGRTAGPQEAQEMHAVLRSDIEARYDARSAARMRILYGGSVKPSNAADLMACEDVDGALVGGASLQADSFVEIARAAARPEQP
ncbi:MAG: triose-phosphate isomerase [Phycisphaerales bacterium]|jgi:triosephosphate isomerase|nr:triose-phosphate isomerase [Phycisphaerales bacterium]